MDFILLLLFIFGVIFLLWAWGNVQCYFDDKRKEKKELDISYRAQNILYSTESFLEHGEVKNGWARVKLVENRYAYVRPWFNRIQRMSPDGEHALYGLNGIFETAEEFDYPSAIVQRKGQYALLGANSEYIIPFYCVPPWQEIRTSLYEIGKDFLAYHKTVYDSKEKENVESLQCIIDRSGKRYFEGKFKKAYIEEEHLVVINDYYGSDEEKEIIEIKSGHVILPFHTVYYELENGKILFYSRLRKYSGWNVFDRKSQSCVFSKSYEGIAYLRKRNAYLLADNDIIIADDKGNEIRVLPGDCCTVYNEEFFKGSHSILDFDGNVITKLSNGSLSFIEARKGDSSYALRVWRTDRLDKKKEKPFQDWKIGSILYISAYNYEDHTHSIIDLKGNIIIGPIPEAIEPNYSFDNELIGFKSLSSNYKEWHLYDLSGKHIKDEPYRRMSSIELDDEELGRILRDIDFEPEDDLDFYDEPPRHYYKSELHPSPVHSKESIPESTTKVNRYLFFDTETTGLPKNYNAPITDLNNWPRLVQLSWILSDSDGKELRVKDFVIKPDGFTIPAESTMVHGISTEIAQREGTLLSNVLSEFIADLKSADNIVGHNIDFDKKIMGAEFIRAGLDETMLSKSTTCTMKSSTDYCKIPGKYGYKWPTLQELHNKLFGEDFEDAHNSLNDIKATKKCFFELKKKGIIN